MIAPSVSVVMETALLPLSWIIGVATWVITSSVTTEGSNTPWVAIAFTVVGAVTENGPLYAVLVVVGSLLSVV